jgi:hypothetical protein
MLGLLEANMSRRKGGAALDLKLYNLLRDEGCVLVKHSKHLHWRLPNGRILITGVTPSDRRAWLNIRSKLRRLLDSPPDSSHVPHEEL